MSNVALAWVFAPIADIWLSSPEFPGSYVFGLTRASCPGLYCSQLCKKHLTTGQLSRKEKKGNQSFPTQKTNGLVRTPGTELAHCAGIPFLCTRCAGCKQEALLKHVLVLLSRAVAWGGSPVQVQHMQVLRREPGSPVDSSTVRCVMRRD